ncbi:hypothetical protein SAMN05444722_1283 [Rhodovulum sp. ES.010]|uniref:hypothetical protein n=1 Tax=Rhodovulum sp. ES.010 TaxID=1882821 RepID=UPI00092B324D|nr:hypothetical protein [Rhodovulum sp. ES.010]SIO29769.1 hypothetical protein SAMN05444722_1283 [Rhodovulum sp. ES.010]
MTGPTVLLAYAGWAAAPLVAYAALSHGLNRAWRAFLVLFGLYTALVWLVWAALRAQAEAAVAPMAVAGPWGGVAILSALLYALGARIGGGE